MNKTTTILTLTSALLAGCAGWGKMDQGLRALHGQPLQVAVQRLGYPVAEEQIAGMRLVVWSVTESWTEHVQHTATTYGVRKDNAGREDYSEMTQYSVPVVRQDRCTIKLQVGQDNIIRGGHYDGGLIACQGYIRALN